jgi:hypothetical protein
MRGTASASALRAVPAAHEMLSPEDGRAASMSCDGLLADSADARAVPHYTLSAVSATALCSAAVSTAAAVRGPVRSPVASPPIISAELPGPFSPDAVGASG